MRITPYNKDAAIEMLRARAFLLLMSDEIASLNGPQAAALFEVVGDMSFEDAQEAIEAFDATQWEASQS